jgi:hypothetical protein
MNRITTLCVGLALTASCVSANASPYESRHLIRHLQVTGSPSSTTSPSTPATGATTTPAVVAALLSPSSADFGAVQVGDTSGVHSFVLSNPDTTDKAVSGLAVTGASFHQTSSCGTSLAAGTSCTVDVTMSPLAVGGVSGTLSATVGGQPLSASLTGTGTTAAQPVYLSETQHNFGSMPVGQSSAVDAITITNRNSSAVSVANISISAGQSNFAQNNNCGTSLAAGASCTVNVTMTPSQTGDFTGTLSIIAGGFDSSVALSGNGQAVSRALGSSQAATFNTTTGITSKAQTITMTNIGNTAVNMAGAAVGTSLFTVTSDQCAGKQLAPNGSCTVTLTFSSATAGTFSDTLTVTSNADNNPLSIALTGVASVPAPRLQMTGVAFGDTAVGVTRSGQVSIINTGKATATLGQLTAADTNFDWAIQIVSDNCSGKQLAPGASCAVALQLESDYHGVISEQYSFSYTGTADNTTYTASATVQANVVDLQLSVYLLDGSGTVYENGFSEPYIAFGTGIPVGTVLTKSLTIVNDSTVAGPVVVEVNGYQLVGSTNCNKTMQPGEACTFTITYTATYANYSETGQMYVGYTSNKVATFITAANR